MSITICGYDFEGPYSSPSCLDSKAGVYTILDKKSNGNYDIVDVGESGNVKDRVENHDRKDCWKRHASEIWYAAYYTLGWTADQRRALEKKIRDEYDPPCGKQ
ncbi:MAG: hypothetical protein IH945_02535 [Armatimonadetes bacterium]|nr:hypothetical protein [Armatimonadota bacterium]